MNPLRERAADGGPQGGMRWRTVAETEGERERERDVGLPATAGNNTPTDRFQSRTLRATQINSNDAPLGGHSYVPKQEAQLSQIGRAMLRVVKDFAKSLKVVQGHSKLCRWVGRL